MVLGILTAVVAASVIGFSDEAQHTSCMSDAHVLTTAVEAYFAQNDTTVIPSADATPTPNSYEKSLVSLGFLHSPSILHDLHVDGQLFRADGSPCTV